MNRWIRRSLLAVVALSATAAAGMAAAAWMGDLKSRRHVVVDVAAVPVPADADALARGRYLFTARGCAECHGADGGGHVVIDDGHGFLVKSPDITRGPGGVVAGYQDVDWVRTIRHGVKPDGRPVFVMPSEENARLTDEDVGALVAWLRAMPPVAGEGAVLHVPVMVRALYGAGVVRDAAEKIDHRLPPARGTPHDGSPAHGAYVATLCVGCHGPTLSGGRIPGAPPSWPVAANLTPGQGGALGRYPDAGRFVAMLRSGRRPDGTPVSGVMPFGTLAALSDEDANALYGYLRTLPPRDAGGR